MPYPIPEGNRWTGVDEAPLPFADVHVFLTDERAGGVCVFTGVSRRWTGEQETESLYYEVYTTMAEGELERLVAAAEARWPLVRVVALHRIGRVAAGEASVVVGAATPHRAEAFAACRWLIDTLKTEVPIWKRDEAPDGKATWVNDPSASVSS